MNRSELNPAYSAYEINNLKTYSAYEISVFNFFLLDGEVFVRHKTIIENKDYNIKSLLNRYKSDKI